MNQVRALIVDDHTIVIEGIERVLELDGRVTVVGKAKSIAEAKMLIQSLRPDVLLLDLRLPDSRGVAEIPVFKDLLPSVKIVVLTGHGTSHMGEARRLGADGFLTKDRASEVIANTICELFDGYVKQRLRDEPILSEREQDVARLVAAGMSNEEVAQALCLSKNTVKTHLANVMEKIGVRDRVNLALYWNRRQPSDSA